MGTPKLSEAAIRRLTQLAKSRKLTPSQVILEFLPDPDMEFEKVLDSPNPGIAPINHQEAIETVVELVRTMRAKG